MPKYDDGVSKKKQSMIVFSKRVTETRQNEARLCQAHILTMFREEKPYSESGKRKKTPKFVKLD